jgi:hypothetical protein
MDDGLCGNVTSENYAFRSDEVAVNGCAGARMAHESKFLLTKTDKPK